MGRPPRRGQPLNKGRDGGSERVCYSEVSLYRVISHEISYRVVQPYTTSFIYTHVYSQFSICITVV